ncbi:hypothetical protein JMF89_00930 [Clostridiaceae bacterium UIB06]|uniref:Uncharacterized protein n=1 Tax=Clostridium thailandense TaxID=2794346 RepID=A0A949TPP6_9CLOT|nr:hypothetical protein [Clostridium thailandense]MBV7273117.1 hypothetical protein [Clostridium thailandense]MCH5135781.1 hypothetical protein [Clostridiaceae bacterium UIB06]
MAIRKIDISREEFDRINEVENFLYNYKAINLAIENLKMELKSLDETTIGSIEYKDSIGKTNKFNSSVENILTRKGLLRLRIEHMETKITQIDRALGILLEIEKAVIKSFYIEDMCYFQFCSDINVSERTCQRIKRRALNKIIISVYGI